jgi:methylphosphotriester-DNA--protein-cysteine methyltransferase
LAAEGRPVGRSKREERDHGFPSDQDSSALAILRHRRRAVGSRSPARPHGGRRILLSVLTTGVYCRSSCAARLARRNNVAFRASSAAAEAAGFRPCQRCRPDTASLAARPAAVVAKACRRIEAADEPPSLEALAKAAGMSRFHFHRVFKAVTGVTPKAYVDADRARRVRDELAQSATVTEAIYNQDIKALLVDRGRALPEFVVWWLRSQEALLLTRGIKHGATVHSLASGFLESLLLPLPAWTSSGGSWTS